MFPNKKVFAFSFVASMCFLFFPIQSKAHVQPFIVSPILPDHQEESVINYISIKTNETILREEVRFLIENQTDEELIVHIEPVNALTSSTGEIRYTTDINEGKSSLLTATHAMTDAIKIEESVIVAPYGVSSITGFLSVSEVENTILGGVKFTTNVQNSENEKVVGVMVDFQKGDAVDFMMGDPTLEYKETPIIHLPIRFDSSLLLTDVSFQFEVLDKYNDRLYKKSTDGNYVFTPKTMIEIKIPLGEMDVKVEDIYKIKGYISYFDYRGEHMSIPFQRELLIDDVLTASENGVKKSQSFDKRLVVFGLGGVTIILLSILLLRRRNKDRLQESVMHKKSR